MTGQPAPADAIELYLDELAALLNVGPARARRVLIECGDHLHDAAAALEDGGTSSADAARLAIERFGSPRDVGRRFAAAEGRLLPPWLLLEIGVRSLGVVGVGLLSIGVSGLVAVAFALAWGPGFVGAAITPRDHAELIHRLAGDPTAERPGAVATSERCANYRLLEPDAADCSDAAVLHHYRELVGLRADAGILGLLVLGLYAATRRWYPRGSGIRLLPDALTPGAAAVLFGVAGGALLLSGTLPFLFGEPDGAGALLSGGLVAVVVGLVYARSALTALRREGPAVAAD